MRKVKCNGTLVVIYIIGYEKYISGEKWHRYMKIPDDIDLILLKNLFNRSHIVNINLQLLLSNYKLFNFIY